MKKISWKIELTIAWRKKPGTFKKIIEQSFEKKREANEFYRELNQKIYKHFVIRYGIDGYSCYALNCHGSKTFETTKEFVCIQFTKN